MQKISLKSVSCRVGYWLVAGIPYLMAWAYLTLLRWKPQKPMIVFKRVPLMALLALHLGGYALWAMDYTKGFLTLARVLKPDFDEPDLGIFDPMNYSHLCRWLHKATHHLLWDPAVGPFGWFWIWLVLFGPVCLALTVRFMWKSRGADPDRIGKLRVKANKVRALAEKSTDQGTFLGASKSVSDTPVLLEESWRTSHTYCVGASRSGKTASVMVPLALQDIAKGHPVIFFDGKGDMETRDALLDKAYWSGRIDDFLVFSMSDIGRSYSYNPLQFGTPTQKKDKLIGAFTWTEEHYKKVAEDTLLTVILGLEGTGERYNLEDVYLCLTDPKALQAIYERCQSRKAKEHLQYLYKNFAATTREITGLIKDLGLIIKSDIWPLLNTYGPQIDLLEVVRKKKIVYFVFNTQAYPETAERMARIVLQDLRAVSDHMQNRVPRDQRVFTAIYVDEFNSFAFDAFGDFMSKCGGAKFALTLAHQSLGQLNKRGEHFKDEILDNANIKIILRQDVPAAIDEFVRMIGTYQRAEYTEQTEDSLLFEKRSTGLGSKRQVEAFHIGPNLIRQLQPHQAALLVKQPFLYDVIQMDVYTPVKVDQDGLDIMLPRKMHSSDQPWGIGINLRRSLREDGKEGPYGKAFA